LHGITNVGVLELIRAHGALDFPPGTRSRYSNSGYVLLALVVARAAGQPFHVFLRQHIFTPAGMHRTLMYDESHPSVPHLARGYRLRPNGDYLPELARDPDGRFAANTYQILTMGDGGMFTTAEDLFRFDRALDGERLLSARAQEEMLRRGRLSDGTPLRRPMSPPQALGWRVGEVPRVRLVRVAPPGVRFALPRVRFALRRMRFASHPGGAGAYQAHFWRFPEARAALVLLSADGSLDVGASVVPLLDLLLTGRVPPTHPEKMVGC